MNTPPPFHFTGDPGLDWIILAAGAIAALYWLRALRLAREGARRFLFNVVRAVLLYFIVWFFLAAALHQEQSRARDISFVIALFTLLIWQGKKRSRHISASVRRAVIERDLPGGKYDPQKHHIDHIYPHSRGGSNTPDNLRVIEKKHNLQKGAKRPRLRDMW